MIGLLAIATWLTLAAPAHVWPGLRDAFPLGWVPLERGLVAAGIVLLAAAVCLSRWLFQRTAMEFAMGLVLIVVGIAQLPVMRADGASGQQSCTDRFSESVNIPASHVLATFLETNQEGNAVYNLQNTDGDERGTCEVDSSGTVVNLSLGG